MPHISMKMYPGRSNEKKEAIAIKIQQLIAEELGCSKEYVSVAIKEIDQKDWKEKVTDKIKSEELIIKPNF